MATRKRKLDLNSDTVEVRFQNWLAQMLNILMPKVLVLIAGRGSTKTTQVQAERVQEVVQDCPGAPFAWVSDTYSNLKKNVIPSLMEGLKFLGWEEGVHYIINKEPPKEWRDKMYVVLPSYKDVMTFYTGFTFTFISLDKSSIGAGRSYVGVFGDEIKYFSKEKIANLLKAVRGYAAKYGDSPWYRSISFTTDMPDPNSLGEYDWALEYAKRNDIEKIMLAMQSGFVYNETKIEYVSRLQELEKARLDGAKQSKVNTLEKALMLAEKNMNRWKDRWGKCRNFSFFWIASSFINADILSLSWFEDEFEVALSGLLTNVCSVIPKLKSNQRFYSNLSEKHFYWDGNDNEYVDSLSIGEEPDCRILKNLTTNQPLEAGLDIGNTLWMVFGQVQGNNLRVMKEMVTLPPRYIREIADEFIRYFKPHKRKVLYLYYDRAANNYKKIKQDVASQIKSAIEFNADGSRSGWSVQLMSLNQGNIGSNAEYNLMTEMMSGNNRLLPKLLIDRNNCPYLKHQLERVPIKIKTSDNKNATIVKEKKGDGLPVDRLLKESTNFTDAFKYFTCRKEYLRIINNK